MALIVKQGSSHFDRCGRCDLATSSQDEPDDGGSIMKQELFRLLSYRNWTVTFMDPTKLAKAGFYYINEGDSVCCAFCNIVLNQWQEGDDPMEDHKKFSKNCPFVLGRECSNIPSNLNSLPSPRTVGHDIAGSFAFHIMPNSLPERETTRLRSTTTSYELPHHGGPKYPEYAMFDQRLKSFRGWPSDKKLTPEQLAGAGFFYQGVDDRTVCFYCRGGLNNWEDNDDAWEQHAKWFPKCNFVVVQKGERFVSEVHNKLGDPVLSKAEVATLEFPSDAETSLTGGTSSTTVVAKPTEVKAKDLVTKDDDCVSLCKVCHLKGVGMLFEPCGHTVACVDCALALTSCPICEEPINARIRAFVV